MFTLNTTATPTYWWPITFRQPSQDEPGELVDVGFEAQFAYLS